MKTYIAYYNDGESDTCQILKSDKKITKNIFIGKMRDIDSWGDWCEFESIYEINKKDYLIIE